MNATANLASSLICQSPEQRRALFAARSAPAPAGNATEFRAGMHTPGSEQALGKNRVLALSAANATLVCLEGELWLTRDGDSEDYILGPGQQFVARHGDRVVVQALQPSRLRLAACRA